MHPFAAADILWAPKMGDPDTSWEDAAAIDPERGSAVILDGVSTSVRAYDWTELLIVGWAGRFPQPDSLDDVRGWLLEACDYWPLVLENPSRLGSVEPSVVPDYLKALAKLRTVAQCTAQLFALRQSPSGIEWVSGAIGDSTLVHIRGGELIAAFPMTAESDFRSPPGVLSSQREDNVRLDERWSVASGSVTSGDAILLMTDAVAEWALTYRHPEVWRTLCELDQASFRRMLGAARSAGMRNDDATLVRMVVG